MDPRNTCCRYRAFGFPSLKSTCQCIISKIALCLHGELLRRFQSNRGTPESLLVQNFAWQEAIGRFMNERFNKNTTKTWETIAGSDFLMVHVCIFSKISWTKWQKQSSEWELYKHIFLPGFICGTSRICSYFRVMTWTACCSNIQEDATFTGISKRCGPMHSRNSQTHSWMHEPINHS